MSLCFSTENRWLTLAQYKEAAVFVEFLGWFRDNSSICLAMEYLPLGDLEKSAVAKLPEAEAREITQQILSGLEIMHAESFAHRDLKPQVSLTTKLFRRLIQVQTLNGR